MERGFYIHKIKTADGVLVRQFEEHVVEDDGLPELHGAWKEWWPDGTLAMERTFCNGDKVGIERYFHPNGVLASLEIYEAGNRSGTYIEFSEDGRCILATPRNTEGGRVGLGFYTNSSGAVELVEYREDGSGTSRGTADLATAIDMFKSAHGLPDEFIAALARSPQ